MDADMKKVFDLGARVGSLEGYLYVGKDVEARYLPGWLSNIEREFQELPAGARESVAGELLEVLRKVAAYLERLYGKNDANAGKAHSMVSALKERES